MINCYDCKYAMIPKVHNILLNLICTNIKQQKGLVKPKFKCMFGVKNDKTNK